MDWQDTDSQGLQWGQAKPLSQALRSVYCFDPSSLENHLLELYPFKLVAKIVVCMYQREQFYVQSELFGQICCKTLEIYLVIVWCVTLEEHTMHVSSMARNHQLTSNVHVWARYIFMSTSYSTIHVQCIHGDVMDKACAKYWRELADVFCAHEGSWEDGTLYSAILC